MRPSNSARTVIVIGAAVTVAALILIPRSSPAVSIVRVCVALIGVSIAIGAALSSLLDQRRPASKSAPPSKSNGSEPPPPVSDDRPA